METHRTTVNSLPQITDFIIAAFDWRMCDGGIVCNETETFVVNDEYIRILNYVIMTYLKILFQP
jgi:hypothetical protein